jgi:hypothetical protein
MLLRVSDAGHGASRIAAIGRHPKPSTKADVTPLESDVCITPESRHHPALACFDPRGPNLNLAVAGFQIPLPLSARCRSWSRVACRQGPPRILAWSAEVHARRGYLQRTYRRH